MSSFIQSELETDLADLVPELRFLEETTSTNAVASEWGAQGAPDGAIVVTNHQTAGRGRLDRSWYAPPGECLLFSTILRPADGSRADQFVLLNLAAAAAMCRSVSRLVPARVKWPNDVMINGRKVAGILSTGAGGVAAAQTYDSGTPEAANPPNQPGAGTFAVIGVGLNVSVAAFPAELAGAATSLLLETGERADRLELLRGFLAEFGRLYASFPEGILHEYEPLCETLGMRVRVELTDHFIEDEAIGIDPTGGLILAGGEVIRAGDVVHLRSSDGGGV